MNKRVLFLLTLVLLTLTDKLHAQGTAFTYQGQLQNNGSPASGNYDFTFALFNTNSTNSGQLGSTVATNAVPVANGLFTVTLDFGANFPGANRWLAIAVRTNGSATFTSLSPLQKLTPTPYAVFAGTASNISGTLPSADLSGTYGNALTLNNAANSFSGNGGGLTNLNASQLIGGTVPDAELSGNVALLNATQTFSAVNKFTASNQSIIINGNGPAGTNIFTGLGLYYDNNTGIASIMSSYNDQFASLNFYTKPGTGVPTTKQVKIDRYGSLMIDQQNANYGALNDGTTNGAGLVFGTGGGEGIASQRTAGVNQNGLDFYTSNSRQMSILNNGNVGIGTTNPSTALQVIGTVTATAFAGNASGLTNLNVTQLSGPISLAQLPVGAITNGASGVTLTGIMNGNGGGLTNLNANNLASGTVPNSSLPASPTFSGTVTASSFSGKGSNLTSLNATQLTTGTVADARLSANAALLNGNQSFTGSNFFTGSGASLTVSGTGSINTGLFTGLGFQFNNSSGEGAIMSSVNDDHSSLTFYTKPGPGFPTTKQIKIDRFGCLFIDQQNQNYGALNDGTTNADGLVFGGSGGEGIASQRTAGVNQDGLDFYTGSDRQMSILNNGKVGIGTNNPQSMLDVAGTTSTQILKITSGSDLAEPFKISTVDQPVSEGEVVVIDEANPGELKLTDQPYDTRVAGVISGANGVHPGIQMQQLGLGEGGRNVALTGRVYVQADTSNGPIKPGDLLTTSSTPGRAMRVTDHAKAQGAILGKAMTGLKDGQGMVLVLVTLQ